MDSPGGRPRIFADPGAAAIRAFAFLLFFVSGFAALLYQVIWQRVLTVFSVTIIVAAFMAGLGLGSLTGGYLADRVPARWRLALFAAAELAVALFALASLWIYYDLLYLRLGGLAGSPVVLAAVLFVSLLWPTFFMGMSLPLLARALTDRVDGAAGTVGALYGVNTLGAAVGAFVTTWVLMRTGGFDRTVQLGAILNICAAVGALALTPFAGRRRGPPGPRPEPAAADEGPAAFARVPVAAWIAIYGLSGFIALSLEIVWFRLLGVMVKSTSETFGTLLAIYLGGLAAGSLCGLWWAPRSRRPAATFLTLQAGVSIYAGLSMAILCAVLGPETVLRPLWAHLGSYDPPALGVLGQIVEALAHGPGALDPAASANLGRLAMAYLLLPLALIGAPTLMMGLSFPFLQRVVQRDVAVLGRRVGWLQAANIFGATLGATVTGWVFLRFLGTAPTLKLLVVSAAVFILLLLVASPARRSRIAWAGAVAALLAVGLIAWRIPSSDALWADLHGASPDQIISAEDGSGLAVLKDGEAEFKGLKVVYANGLGQSTVPFASAHLALGMLPVMLHPNPRRVAIVGLGSGATAFASGGRGETTDISVIEIVAPQYDNLKRLQARTGDPGLGSLLGDKRFGYRFGDARAVMRRQGRKYDVIEADALRPTSAYAGNLYSKEYFTLLKQHLAPGGFAVSWAATDRVIDTFVSVFPYALLHTQPDVQILIGSNQPIAWNGAAAAARLRSGFTAAYYARGGVAVGPYMENFAQAQPRIFSPGDARPRPADLNSDLFPRDEFRVPRTP